jgi:hypothetical protein
MLNQKWIDYFNEKTTGKVMNKVIAESNKVNKFIFEEHLKRKMFGFLYLK